MNTGCILNAQAQDSIVYPNYQLKDYFPIGLTFGVDRSIVSNEPIPHGQKINYQSTYAKHIGLTANLYNNKYWNIRASARLRIFDITQQYVIPGDLFDDFNERYDFIFSSSDLYLEDYKFNISGDYIFKSKPKADFFVGLGAEVTFWEAVKYMDPETIEIGNSFSTGQIFSESNSNWYFGANFDFGVYLKSYNFLYRLMLTYHHNFSPAIESLNLTNASTTGEFEETSVTQRLPGNYYGLSLAIHPSKNLFKKKPTAYKIAEKQKKEESKSQSIHQTYSKFGLSYGMKFNTTERVPNSVNLEHSSVSRARQTQIGLHWHYHNRKNYTLSWALEYNRLSSSYRLNLGPQETGTSNTYSFNPELSALNGFGISHYFDYLFPINKTITLNAGLGLKLAVMNQRSEFFEFDLPDIELSFEYGKTFFFDPFFSPSIGADINLKHMLLRFKLFADILVWGQDNPQMEFRVIATNSNNGFSWSNEIFRRTNFGFNLNIYPKKGLFKKSKKK